jgi:UDP-GlcNAc:undecaprenyl-phosphate GlcNAc-1-phosphate transferase
LGWLGGPLTVAWLILGINALNLLDGIDGLASLAGILVSLAVAVIAASLGSTTLMVPALLLPAALAGFLFHNRPPARIYLGDAGSMLVGLLVAAMAVQLPSDGPAAMNASVAILLLLLPLADTGLAILRRTLRKQSPLDGDRGHVHHCLLQRGFSVGKALGVLGSLCLANGCLAWFVAVKGQELLAWSVVAAGLPLLVYTRVLGYQEWRLFVGALSRAALPWLPRGGVARAGEEKAAVLQVAVEPTVVSPVPEPHFHRDLQPSGESRLSTLNATGDRRGSGHREDVVRSRRNDRLKRRPR